MPIRIDHFEEVDDTVFEEYPRPVPPGKQVDPVWAELLTRLEQGGVVRLPVRNEAELRGLRLALGRRAVGRGFRVETRNDGQTLVARRRDEPSQAVDQGAASADAAPRRRGRPREQPVPDAEP